MEGLFGKHRTPSAVNGSSLFCKEGQLFFKLPLFSARRIAVPKTPTLFKEGVPIGRGSLNVLAKSMCDKRTVNRKELKAFRRNLRKNLTPAEVALWQHLKAGKLNGTSWRRQFSVGDYILDFYCPVAKLCVELDGEGHFTMQGDTYDYDRTEFLTSLGIRVLRFENKDVWGNIELVLETISGAALGVE